MLVRIRCKIGNFRYEVQDSDDLSLLVSKVLADAPDADPTSLTFSNQPRGGEHLVYGHAGTLKQYGISHGDLIFASWQDKVTSTSQPMPTAEPAPSTRPTTTVETSKDVWRTVVEDPVDVFLEQQDGKITRQRDAKMCRHGDKGMCDYCMPLEPYDEKYQLENKIKHLSFHAYLRKLDTAGNNASKEASYIPPLEEPSYKVQVPCSSGSHPSWPAGICSKCQPSAITLALQSYRMVDHVEYSSPAIIENFLDFWRRQAGAQRFGYLVGRYEVYDQVPLGIKAVVEAIFEPPQAGDVDGIEVNMETDLADVSRLASACGLQIVGMVYTDLLHDPDSKEGKVICKRHADSFFLSSLETIFAAKLQAQRPNASRFCMSGKYSSKFVTCVITGNEQGEIEVKAYQASEQAMALVDADLIEASVEPSVMRVRKEDDPADDQGSEDDTSKSVTKRYVPEVFYRYKNEYNIQVQESAKPCFPVDYLLVSLTHGFPASPNPLFASNAFAIENRQGFQDQTQELVLRQLGSLARALPADTDVLVTSKGKGKTSDVDNLKAVANWISDWHLLYFLQTEFVGKIIEESDLRAMIKVAVNATKQEDACISSVIELVHTAGWQTLAAFAAEHGAPATSSAHGADFDIPPELLQDAQMNDSSSMAQDDFGTSGGRTCPHCTFENEAGARDCEPQPVKVKKPPSGASVTDI